MMIYIIALSVIFFVSLFLLALNYDESVILSTIRNPKLPMTVMRVGSFGKVRPYQCPDNVSAHALNDRSGAFSWYNSSDDGWGLPRAAIDKLLLPMKIKYFCHLSDLKNGDSIYETACGRGSNYCEISKSMLHFTL